MKINPSAGRCVFSGKGVNVTKDELFSIFKSEHFLNAQTFCALSIATKHSTTDGNKSLSFSATE